MTTLQWIDRLFAAFSVALAVFWTARIVVARRAGSAVSEAVAHTVMALGMAAMFAPALDPLPPVAWIAIYVIGGAWLIASVPRLAGGGGLLGPGQRQHAHLIVSAAAMAYMFVAMNAPAATGTTPAAMPGMVMGGGGISLVPLTALFGLYFLAHAAWSARAVLGTRVTSGGAVPAALPAAPTQRLPALCHVVMGVAMSYMFATMLG